MHTQPTSPAQTDPRIFLHHPAVTLLTLLALHAPLPLASALISGSASDSDRGSLSYCWS